MAEVPLHMAAEVLSLDDAEIPDRGSAQAGVSSLPNELLLRVLEALTDKELYSHIRTCRAFHDVSLHILFNRQFNKILSGQIHLHNSPEYILPAVHGALFLHDLHDISILFNPEAPKFFTEMRVLTEIIQRMERNTRLSLNMKRVGSLGTLKLGSRRSLENLSSQYEELAKALQGLIDLALKKGSTRLYVFTGDAFKSDLNAIGWRPRQKTSLLSKSVLTESQPLEAVVSGQPNAGLSIVRPAPNISNPIIPVFPTHSDALSPPKKRGSIILSSPFLFSEFLLDWTLSLLNYGNFSKFEFLTSHFEFHTGIDTLPKIQMDNLNDFLFDGDTIDPYEVTLFLQRHSGTLESISLSLSRYFFTTSWIPAGRWCSSFSDHPSSLYLDFPLLRHLAFTSYHIPWFLDGLMSNPKATQFLPNLSSLTIRLFPDRPEAPNLDQVLESILSLVNLENPGHRCADWLSYLRLNAKGVSATSFIGSLDTYIIKHSTSGPNSKPKVARIFPTVQELRLEFRFMATDLDIFDAICRFLAFFPNVKRFEVGSVSREAVKQREGAYWQEARVHCPNLEEVVFDGFAEPLAKMDNLVRGAF